MVIAGPTASGKSALALELAEREGGVLINADASQVYADLRILSARPSESEEAHAPHRLFGCMDGAEHCSATRWASLARVEVVAAHAAGRLPILVGGTGMYLRTLLEGMAPVPVIAAEIRAAVRALGAEAARAALEQDDPLAASRLHPNDSQRNARALEVFRSTGRSIVEWQKAHHSGGIADEFAVRALVVDIDRALLMRRIDRRIDAMWSAGALEEVAALLARRLPADAPVLRAIGVPPLADLLSGRCDGDAALERWRIDTRRYAKRQMTWLRNQWPGWDRVSAPA